jgi:hypothetical protein
MSRCCRLVLLACAWLGITGLLRGPELSAAERGPAWTRHTIDNSSRGADGVRLADANGDGLADIVTGWEEGGLVRIYLNPGPAKAKAKWPAVTVGAVGSPEDAVLVDLDGDGAVDVVTSCEGKVRSVFVHWAPKDAARYLHPSAWKTEAFPALGGLAAWMFCQPLQVDGKYGTDLVLGAKNPGGCIGWLQAPADPRNLAAWRWHHLYDAGWIMSLVPSDLDGDGDLDVLASDRKGPNRGCLWLENPGPKGEVAGPWKVHRIGAGASEVMFLDLADLDGDGLLDVVVLTREREVFYHRRLAARPVRWEEHVFPLPANTGTGKAVRVADLDLDGKPDLVFTCEGSGGKSGVGWMSCPQSVRDPVWDAHEVSGTDGIKYDLIQLVDLDGDGDLDVLTTEEQAKLGVIWYENPTRRPVGALSPTKRN